ncbi:MAG TPA: ABC transporter ATP-binding protein [Candidatus Nanopelagicaceae bacterium]
MNIGLRVEDLHIAGPNGPLVHGINFEIESGKSLAIIGESGSGKTLTARAVTGVLPRGVIATGSITIKDKTIALGNAKPNISLGEDAVLLLQDPYTSLSPVHTCGEQIAWTIQARNKTKIDIKDEVLARLEEVQLPERIYGQYPHELSGGMRQRVAIAAAIAADSELFIADEPTSALDASTQGEILDLLRRLQESRGMTLILISHDLGIVRRRADIVIVMKSGTIVEMGTTQQIFQNPQHDYTKMLLAASPSIDVRPADISRRSQPRLQVRNLNKSFGRREVLRSADIEVGSGEIVALLGESGSGKTTLARCIAGLEIPDSGDILLVGKPLTYGRKGRSPQDIQMVFQDPYSTLNPFFTVQQTLGQALSVAGRSASEVPELLEMVGLAPEIAKRRARQLSGGQRQRVAIARALAPRPSLLICDEAVSALDVTVQAQILDLLMNLRNELNLSVLFISHDIAVVSYVSDYVYIVSDGKLVEEGSTANIMRHQSHPATAKIVAAARSESL